MPCMLAPRTDILDSARTDIIVGSGDRHRRRDSGPNDRETIGLLTYYFQPTEMARNHHWTVDWDITTIIQALEELYPLQQEHRQLDRGSRWLQVVADSRSRVRILADNMDQVRRDMNGIAQIPMLDPSHTYNRARCSKIWHGASPTGPTHGITTGPMSISSAI